MTEHTQLHRPKQSDTPTASASYGTPQGKQLFVDNSARVSAQSEVLDTLIAPSTAVVQRVEENKDEQKPEYLDLDDNQWVPKDSIRGNEIEVPDGTPQIADYNFNTDKQPNLNYRPNRKKWEQAESITEILGHSTKRWGSISTLLNAILGGLNNTDKNK